MKPGVFARVSLNSSSKVGMSSNCITCVIGSKESPDAQRKGHVEEGQGSESKLADEQDKNNCSTKKRAKPKPASHRQPRASPPSSQSLPHSKEAQFCYSSQAFLRPKPFPRSKARQTLAAQHIQSLPDATQRNALSCNIPRRRFPNTVTPAQSLTPDCRSNLRWHQATVPKYGTVCGPAFISFASSVGSPRLSLSDDSSSCDSFGSLSSFDSLPVLPRSAVLDSRKRAVGTLQREMNALFAQKMEELRHKSPLFLAGKA
ncbi:uncharacterized protein [Syngnathus scovelli]|uniref:uncharacterized protein n=1 Tax=Syngnathus scovelli TaxID=161590 RepID=UPI0035CC779F